MRIGIVKVLLLVVCLLNVGVNVLVEMLIELVVCNGVVYIIGGIG